VPYVEAMAVVDVLARALEQAHAAGFTLGALTWANVLVGRDGRVSLIGFGHNVVAYNERGYSLGTPLFQAPEVGAGGPPTPSGDLYAFVAMQRALLPYLELPPELVRAFAAPAGPDDDSIEGLVAWSSQRIVTGPPERRPSVSEARRRDAREWELLGLRPDHAAVQARLAKLLADEESPVGTMEASGDQLVIGKDAEWVRAPSGERHVIARLPLRRLLLRLARERQDRPGQRLDVDTLLESGWPGEQPIREAGLNRVYVAISLLRKLGLREALQRNAEGYRLDPDLAVTMERRKTS
jgi:hypothetical protein